MSKRVSYGAIGLVILGLAMHLSAAGSTSATAPLESKDVVIVNATTQPVPTVVQGTASVTLSGIADVLVANTIANPVNVRDISRTEIFSYPITFGINVGSKSAFQSLPIPAGKRFVIQSVSIQAFAPVGQKFLGRLVTLSSGNSVIHNVTMSDQGAGLGGSASDMHTGDRELLGYADAGALQVVMLRNDDAGSVTVSGVLTGYLMDMP